MLIMAKQKSKKEEQQRENWLLELSDLFITTTTKEKKDGLVGLTPVQFRNSNPNGTYPIVI